MGTCVVACGPTRDHFLTVCLLFSVAQKVSPLWRFSPSCRGVRKAWTKEFRVRGVFSWSVKMHVYSLRPLHLCSSLRSHQRPLFNSLSFILCCAEGVAFVAIQSKLPRSLKIWVNN